MWKITGSIHYKLYIQLMKKIEINEIKAGTSQCSVLGPALDLMCTNDMPELMQGTKAIFTGDTTIPHTDCR